MRTPKNIIGLLVVAIGLFACVKHNTPPPPEEDMLYLAESLNQDYPDSALKILDTLNFSVLSKMEHAHYCLLKAMVSLKLKRNQAEADSLLEIAKTYYHGSPDKYHEAMAYWIYSDRTNLTDKGDQIVIDNRLKALQCIEQCQHIDERLVRYSLHSNDEQNIIDRLKYAIQLRVGISYSKGGYYREAIEHLRASESFFAAQDIIRLHNYAANQLAFTYLKINVFDSCLMYFKKGLHSAEATESIENCAYYHSCIAEYCLYRIDNQQYINNTEYLELLQQSVSECNEGIQLIHGRKATNIRYDLYDKLSHSYYHTQQFDSCIKYSDLALDIIKGCKQCAPNELKKRLYNAYRAIGDEQNAILLADFLVNLEDNETEEQKSVAEIKDEYDKKLEMQRLESEQQLKRYRLYLWIALLVIGLMAVLWAALRYRKNKELEMLKLHEAQNQLQSELEHLTAQQKERLLQQALAIYQTGPKDKLQHIMASFESAYPQALEKMKSAYPKLSKTELNIVILSFLQFRAKEIAELLGLSENTVMQYRSNSRKKTGNAPIFDLFE